MKVLSIDIIRKEFTNLVITEIIHHTNWVEMNYEINNSSCITGMMLNKYEFHSFLDGNIVELHKGEIAIVKVEED